MGIVISGQNQEFALRISDARRAAKLTQEELASRVGIDKKSISQYENGHMFPRGKTINTLAEHLGVDPVWLATGHTQKAHEYLANQYKEVAKSRSTAKVGLVFIEEWTSLSSETPPNLYVYNAEPRYGLESAAINAFVPVSKTVFDRFRATRYPGEFSICPGDPAGSILIFDSSPITFEQVKNGELVIFRLRGLENEPGLRRVVREPGVPGANLVAINPSMHAGPIPYDITDIEILGVVVWQIIQRRMFQ